MTHAEQPLGGNQSGSVRVGDTVRRRAAVWTPAVHELLAHLRRVGFDAAPESLGLDEQGRAVLRFIDGVAHAGWPDPMPSWMYEDETTLAEAARLLRRYHDAVATFVPPADARWNIVAPGAHELICHNDWAPYNALFRGRAPIVMLDWDSAGPGTRLWDVALAAYQWVPMYPMAEEVSHRRVLTPLMRRARLGLFCGAYGEITAGDALTMLIEQLPFLAKLVQQKADAGDPGFAKLAGWKVPGRLRTEARLLRAERALLVDEGS